MNSNYHIDTTPEEDNLFTDKPTIDAEYVKHKMTQPRSYLIWTAVIAVHAVGVGCLLGFSPKEDSSKLQKPPEQISKDSQQPTTPPQQAVAKETTPPKPAQTSNQTVQQKTVAPPPAPKVIQKPVEQPKPAPAPAPKIVQKPVEQPKHVVASSPATQKWTKDYTVKQGDTLNGIAKRYHLNTQRLIKINNIQDVNKVSVGQVLKFM